MAFLQWRIEAVSGVEIDGTCGREFIDDSAMTLTDKEIEALDDDGHKHHQIVADMVAEYLEGSPRFSAERISGYSAYLTAPGYIDRTDYGVFPTVADAAESLLDLAFDGSPDDMDDDEKQAVEELSKLARGD
jgi:hypothetical protein